MLTFGFSSARMRRALASISWSTVDQILSALSNFVIMVAVTRTTGAEGLGQFAVAFSAYLVVLGFSRSLISQPLLAHPHTAARKAENATVTLTLAFACMGAIVVAGVGVALGRPAMLVAAASLPVTLFQDLLRFQAFRRKKPRLAALADGGWLIGSLLAWPVITTASSPSVALGCWAGAALLGTLAGWLALRPGIAGPRAAVAWWRRDTRGLAIPLTFDSILSTISTLGLVFIVAWMIGDAALGVLRAGQVYFGPLGTLFTAFSIFAVPHLAQRRTVMSVRLAFQLSAAITAIAIVACGATILAEPVLQTVLYADAIDVPLVLMIPIAAQVVLAASGSGLSLISKVRHRAGDIAWSRLWSSLVGLALILAATHTYGLKGAAWALVAQAATFTAMRAVHINRHKTANGRVPPSGMVSEDA